MTITILVTLLVSIIGRFMAEEVKAWFGWVHKTLRRKAVEKLPVACRDRYDEEWASAIEEIPGELFKLIHSMGLLRAAVGIRQACGADVVRSSELLIVLKRAFDIFFSILMLIALGPLLLAIAILIRIDSPGPVFDSYEIIGKKGQIFRCFQFRIMVRVAEKRMDMRFTRLGRFLCKYGLNELPQLFNILRGEMSVVGPQPMTVIGEFKTGDPRPHLDSAPGMTGLWQVEDSSPYSPVSIDELYLRNRSFWLDIKIIMRTIVIVFRYRR